jgi:hypothetical protein
MGDMVATRGLSSAPGSSAGGTQGDDEMDWSGSRDTERWVIEEGRKHNLR